MTVFLEILLIFVLVLANGVFALSEIAIVSSRKARLQGLVDQGNRGARAALQLAQDPGRFLATVQIGITSIGILAGTFGGATLSEHLAAWLSHIPGMAPAAGAVSIAIVVMAITYASLIIGELVPKRVGLGNPERLASLVARPMRLLAKMSRPAVWFLQKSSDFVLWLVRFKQPEEQPVTEEEIKLMIEQGRHAGVFEEIEERMVKGVFRLADRTAGAIMTPRQQIDWLDLDHPMKELQHQVLSSSQTYFPVGRGAIDNLLGITDAKTFLGDALQSEHVNPELGLEKAFFVPETMLAISLLDKFRSMPMRMALVVDEFGTIAGMITPYCIVEAVTGDLSYEEDADDDNPIQREDGSWLIGGSTLLDDFKDHFAVNELPDESPGAYQTIAGYVMAQFGHLPVAGERWEHDDWTMEVIDMDGRRIDKLLVTYKCLPDSTDEYEG